MRPTLLICLLGGALCAASPAPLAADAVWSQGRSGRLQATAVAAGEWLPLPPSQHRLWQWRPSDGREPVSASISGAQIQAPDGAAGIWHLEGSSDGQRWQKVGPALITRLGHDWRSAALNGYRMGIHPAVGRTGSYAPPVQFIEVTKENRGFAVSEHFRLEHFLTKDQHDVWPKYLPLDLRLVDKLELVITALRERGHNAAGLHVMSGFRTPAYNGPGTNGRAKFSRRTYGDAADIWVDTTGDGQMDDLNGDGKVDRLDALWLAELVEEIEQAHPELVGGAGVYREKRTRGPFTHIDVRGHRARW
jgi:hypothetical protein